MYEETDNAKTTAHLLRRGSLSFNQTKDNTSVSDCCKPPIHRDLNGAVPMVFRPSRKPYLFPNMVARKKVSIGLFLARKKPLLKAIYPGLFTPPDDDGHVGRGCGVFGIEGRREGRRNFVANVPAMNRHALQRKCPQRIGALNWRPDGVQK